MVPNENAAGNGQQKKKKKGKKTSSPLVQFVFAVLKTVLVLIIALGCAFGGILGGAVLGYVKNASTITPDQLQLTKQTSFIYDMDEVEIAQLKGGENRVIAEHDEIPDYMRDAFIAIEDNRFYSHKGVDWKRFLGAALSYIVRFGNAEYGGSTITQQLVKNITGNEESTIKRKVQEAWQALALEKNLSKDQILDNYMNRITTGAGTYGVQAAAKRYFNKEVKDLSLAECASIAGITKSPGAYDPLLSEKNKERNKKRQETILGEMLRYGKITQNEYDQAMAEELKFYTAPEETATTKSVQSYFVDYVLEQVKKDLMEKYNWSSNFASDAIYNGGLKIYTTQDTDIQNIMTTEFSNIENFPANKKISNPDMQAQAAMLILDPTTGQVRGIYGGYGEKKASFTLNRATSTKRQPGSSFKPIAAYAPAIDLGLITAATAVDDVPVYMNNKTPDTPYPTNFDSGVYEGLIPIRKAITKSQNVVAAKVFRDYLGADKSVDYLAKVGIDMSNEKYVSMALGGLNQGVNPLVMAGSYIPFVNNGVYLEPIAYTKVTDSKGNVLIDNTQDQQKNIVYKETTAYLMTSMMRDVVTNGTAYPYGIVKNEKGKVIPTAGKTGTSSDFYDKWFVGYSPYYVAATWYGYNTPKTIPSAERNQALALWNNVMNKIHAKLEYKDFSQPSEDIIKRSVCVYSGKSPGPNCSGDPRGNAVKTEFFAKGTEPSATDICDIHVSAKVDPTSKDIFGRPLLANPYCPSNLVVDKVFIKRVEPFLPKDPADLSLYKVIKDWIYELPQEEYCTIHGPNTVSPSTGNSSTPGTNTPGGGTTPNDDHTHEDDLSNLLQPID